MDKEKTALEALAKFADTLSDPAFSPGEFVPARRQPDGTLHIGYPSLSPEALAFVSAAYEAEWIRPFDWGAWKNSAEASRLFEDRSYLAQATPDQLSRLLTTVVRQDRFCEGVLLEEFTRGTMAGIAQRAKTLRAGS